MVMLTNQSVEAPFFKIEIQLTKLNKLADTLKASASSTLYLLFILLVFKRSVMSIFRIDDSARIRIHDLLAHLLVRILIIRELLFRIFLLHVVSPLKISSLFPFIVRKLATDISGKI
jgi:hypothetical protein